MASFFLMYLSAFAVHFSYASLQGELDLRVLSYNIHGLPVSSHHERYSEIGKILAERRLQGEAPQLVMIQEAFVSRTHELTKEAGYPYAVEGPQASGVKLGSGLRILSEFPVLETHQMVYKKCMSWDCFARKGALHVRVEVPALPQPLELFTTHLNSDPDSDPAVTPEEAERVRIDQVSELGFFMKKVKHSQAPGIFAADFNFHPGGLDYLFFVFNSNMKNSTERCITVGSCTGDSHAEEDFRLSYDHQFYLSGVSPEVKVRVTHFERNFKEKVNGHFLSDHSGLEIHYHLSW